MQRKLKKQFRLSLKRSNIKVRHCGCLWTELLPAKLKPDCSKNQTLTLWLLIGLSYLRPKLPSLRWTQYVKPGLEIREASDSSVPCVRHIPSTIFMFVLSYLLSSCHSASSHSLWNQHESCCCRKLLSFTGGIYRFLLKLKHPKATQ